MRIDMRWGLLLVPGALLLSACSEDAETACLRALDAEGTRVEKEMQEITRTRPDNLAEVTAGLGKIKTSLAPIKVDTCPATVRDSFKGMTGSLDEMLVAFQELEKKPQPTPEDATKIGAVGQKFQAAGEAFAKALQTEMNERGIKPKT